MVNEDEDNAAVVVFIVDEDDVVNPRETFSLTIDFEKVGKIILSTVVPRLKDMRVLKHEISCFNIRTGCFNIQIKA